MRKALKFIVPAVCILVVAVTFYLMFRLKWKIEDEMYGTEDIALDEDVWGNEYTENTATVNAENIVEDDNEFEITNVVSSTSNVVEDDHVVKEEDSTLSTKNQKSAIQLVEDYWGEDNTIYFTSEGVTKDGEYIVAVRQKTSTTVKDYFKVNLEDETVEIYY